MKAKRTGKKMEMPGAEEYLLRIRKMCGPDTLIIVPNTKLYQDLLNKLNDNNIKLKEK